MNKPNIVVIAQDSGLQEQFKNMVVEEYEHLMALNGIDGVAISRMARPVAVVIDANMSQPKAAEVCKSLSSHDSVRSIPVLILADATDISSELSSLPNFGGVIQQPLQAEQVKAKIQDAIQGKSKAGQKSSGQREEPIRVLSVDDSSVVRKLVTMILTAEGFKVTTASDGLEGINKAKELHPDIILLDFVMPKMNGFQVCRILQKDEALSQIPVILVTSKGDKVGDKFVNQLGVTGYITKPFQPEELVSKIHQTLESPQNKDVEPEDEPQTAPVTAATPSGTMAKPAAEQTSSAKPAATPRTAEQPSADSLKQMVQDILASDFEEKIHDIVKTELSKFMKSLDKRIEKQVIEKMNEYIRRAKKK